MTDYCRKHNTEYLAQEGCSGCLDERLHHTRLIFKREAAILAGVHDTANGPFKEGVGYTSRVLPSEVTLHGTRTRRTE